MINLYWIASIWRQNDLKCWVTSQTIQTAKLQKWSTYTELHRFDVKTSKNDELRRKTFKTTQNYESDQIILNCIDLTSKRSTMMSYVANHSKPLNYKSDQLILNCIDLTSKGSKMLSSRKPFKTAKLQKWSNYNICIDLTSKRAKMMSYVAKHSKLRKTTKVINLYWITSIWRQNEQKWWVTWQNIQNNAKLRKWSNYNICIDLTSKRSTMMSYVANHSKPLNYKSDQLILNCIGLTSKRSKMLSYVANHSNR